MNSDGAHSLAMREPPASLEAEKALLGSCLMDPSVIDEAASILGDGDFFRDAHDVVWRAILDLHERGRDVNAVTLADHLGARFERMNGMDLLEQIMAATPHSANGQYFAHIIRAKATLRKLIAASNETLVECYSNEATPDQIVGAAESRVLAVADRDAGSGLVDAGTLIVESMSNIHARNGRQPRGVMTGFDDLDWVTDGFKKQDLVIVAARPSMGKTAFACSIAVHAALEKIPTMFFSIEMNAASLGERLLACEASVAGDRLRRPWEMDDAEKDRLGKASRKLSGAEMQINDRPSQSVSQMAAAARRMRARRGLGLVVIDYLSLIDGQRQRGENRQEEVARISRRLKMMARELDCPVVCLHQLNRQAESRDGHRPRLSDLRESGQIEQDADMVLLLHRPDYYDVNDSPGVAEVIVAKNRNGPTKAVRLAFHRHCTRFDPINEPVY